MAHEFKMERVVEFAETDMAGIVHFSNYFRYMESAEHAFFRSLGLSLHTGEVGGAMRGFARVGAECRWSAPLRYQDRVEMHLVVREKRSSALRYDVTFRRLGDGEATACAQGSLTVVCVAGAPGEPMRAVPLPPEVAERIEVAPAP